MRDLSARSVRRMEADPTREFDYGMISMYAENNPQERETDL